MFKGFIRDFDLYEKEPNAIHFGSLYTKQITIPCAKEKDRTLRVWLPYNYDGVKRFGVIYMTDGQNAVDSYTSPYGEWDMEDHIQNLQDEGYEGFIIVGIDCPKNPSERMKEYAPYRMDQSIRFLHLKVYGREFAEFIVDTVKPLIDSHFMTKPDYNAFCGSSMGGLFSFYICSRYPEIFNFCISYSPAFCLYSKRSFLEHNKKWNPNPNVGTIYAFYAGGKDKFESKFARAAAMETEFLHNQGFTDKQVQNIYDADEIHHESAWSKYVEASLRFCLKK